VDKRLGLACSTALAALGLWATALQLDAPIGLYDEGLLLTHSRLLQAGFLPYRDFYSNYPPGIYLVVGALWGAFGVSPLPVRFLAIALHVAVAALAGRLAGRAEGRAFEPGAAAIVLLWLAPLGVVAYAWLAGLAAALLALELLLLRDGPRRGVLDFCAGLALGAVSCFRHDLFVYLVLVLVPLGLWTRGRPAARTALAFAGGLVVPLLLVWLPVCLGAGLRQPLDDLLLDQVRYVNPARRLPLPPLFAFQAGLPAFLQDPFPGAVAWTLAAPALALAALTTLRLRIADRRPLLLLGALGLASLPQMLGRTDLYHALFTVTPGLALSVAIAVAAAHGRSVTARATIVCAAFVVMLLPLRASLLALPPGPPRLLPGGPPPYRGIPSDPERQDALAFVRAHTRPGEPIYVGWTQHRRMSINEVDFYFFADRPGVTRYLQFDPNMQTREAVQRQMIAEIERRRPRLAVLSDCCYVPEPNASAETGSDLLDRHLAERYGPVARFGRYTLLWRRDAVSAP
jgi:hypothetical protein